MSTDTNMETPEIIDGDNMDNTDNLSDSDSEDTDKIDLQPYCDKMKWSEENNKKWLEQIRAVFEEIKKQTHTKKKKGMGKVFKIHYEDNRDDVWKCLKLKNWVKHNNCTTDKKITFRHKFANEEKHNEYVQAWTEFVAD